VGAEQARALALFTFGLPGSCYVYQGQELGLPDADLADAERQDPAFIRSKGTQKGRDGARVPLPWTGEITPFGFTSGMPWLPIPQEWEGLTIENQSNDEGSSLKLYRDVISLRKSLLSGGRDFAWTTTPNGSGVISFRRGTVEITLNTSDEPVRLKTSGRPLISSNGLSAAIDTQVELPPRTCIWLDLS